MSGIGYRQMLGGDVVSRECKDVAGAKIHDNAAFVDVSPLPEIIVLVLRRELGSLSDIGFGQRSTPTTMDNLQCLLEFCESRSSWPCARFPLVLCRVTLKTFPRENGRPFSSRHPL